MNTSRSLEAFAVVIAALRNAWTEQHMYTNLCASPDDLLRVGREESEAVQTAYAELMESPAAENLRQVLAKHHAEKCPILFIKGDA